MNDAELLDTSDVARIFNVAPQTVSKWARSGLLQAFRTPGGVYRFRRADVEALTNPGGTPAPLPSQSGRIKPVVGSVAGPHEPVLPEGEVGALREAAYLAGESGGAA